MRLPIRQPFLRIFSRNETGTEHVTTLFSCKYKNYSIISKTFRPKYRSADKEHLRDVATSRRWRNDICARASHPSQKAVGHILRASAAHRKGPTPRQPDGRLPFPRQRSGPGAVRDSPARLAATPCRPVAAHRAAWRSSAQGSTCAARLPECWPRSSAACHMNLSMDVEYGHLQ